MKNEQTDTFENNCRSFEVDPEVAKEMQISECENLAILPRVKKQPLYRSAGEAIAIYDNVFNDESLRVRAANTVKVLAKRYEMVLDMVIESARKYAETQHIDDASPYSPNSFDILADIGCGNEKVLSFLEETVRKEWGIPRWKAIELLCGFEHPEAHDIVVGILQGKYPPKYLDFECDARKIARIKGQRFVEGHRT